MIDYDYILNHLPEIIILVALFVIFSLQIRKKTLTYTILTNSSLVSDSDKAKDNIQIHYKGKVIPNVRLVEIRIKNSGNLPIRPDDYVEPLRIRPSSSNILSGEVRDTYSLGASIEKELSNQSEIVLSKTLLNPKDFFDVRLFLSGGNADLSLIGRIVGVTTIQNLTGREVNYYILLSLVSVNVLALIARLIGWLDNRIIIILQICTLLVGVWLSFDMRAKPEELEIEEDIDIVESSTTITRKS